ncbi:hypothetical protein NQ318_010503, partial [Aromia moschata]
MNCYINNNYYRYFLNTFKVNIFIIKMMLILHKISCFFISEKSRTMALKSSMLRRQRYKFVFY